MYKIPKKTVLDVLFFLYIADVRRMMNGAMIAVALTFGDRLQAQLEKANMRASELAQRSGISKQNISRLLNNTPHPITGALPTVRRNTVEKLARILHWPLSDAYDAAGFKLPDSPREGTLDNVKMLFRGAGDIPEEDWPEFVEELKAIGQTMLDLRAKKREQHDD